MTTDPSSIPNLTDDDYVLWTKWCYQVAQQSGNAANDPDFGDPDHTLMYKVAKSSYELEQA